MLMNLVVMVTLLATPTPPAPASAPASPTTWTVTGSDVSFELTAQDLRALREGREVFGLQSRKQPFLARYAPKKGRRAENTSGWSAAESYTVLSVVGSWVSYELFAGSDTGGAHPSERTTYVTVDVENDAREVSLLDVFARQQLLKALKADAFVKKHIVDAEAFEKASTLDDMLESLGPGEDCVGFNHGFDAVKSSFAFHHLEGDKVAVRIAFGYDAEACRGQKFVVGLLLPIPDAARPALERAAKREEGFLMKDMKAVHAPSVQFSWESPSRNGP